MNWLIVVQLLVQGLLWCVAAFAIIALGSAMLAWANKNMERIEGVLSMDLRWWLYHQERCRVGHHVHREHVFFGGRYRRVGEYMWCMSEGMCLSCNEGW